jgi:UDP-N-acetylmuramate dehydrogenase
MLLEAVGAKTLKVGGAEVSPGHANFVFNKGATSRDILELSFRMQEAVYQEFGAWLEYEMEVLGLASPDLARRLAEKRPHRLDETKLKPLRDKLAKVMGRSS